MRKFNFFLISCLLATSMFFVAGCDDKNDPDNPSNSVPDPEGTMVTNIRNDIFMNRYTGVYYGLADVGIGGLSMNQSNVFQTYGDDRFDIAYIGTVNGLGSIQSIPKENLFTKNGCAVLEKGGYVLRGIDSNNHDKYARLYVTRFMTSGGGIVGAEIKYQYPFVP